MSTANKRDKKFHQQVMATLANKRRQKRRAAIWFAKTMGWTIINSKGKVLVKNPKWSSKRIGMVD